ncbi:MAG: ATP-dependent DNA helicase RecQ [uncultured Chloroflexi bacterium]|uniref:ATP-dependent DNA helicase RecQ n=1 Tax=uncultured Chloroflexota bacterium TaxID=166587 RepID=A0A6J4J2C3_9CHLR|nr:MAG: ATP-dependent DNA helicase RecQ [uncultured Chloroflexota bacterium]
MLSLVTLDTPWHVECHRRSVTVSARRLRARLREHFGLEAFRPGQEETIRALLAGQDVLAVLPTGAGKSLVFQLAAQLLPGVTIVVSPLLALMKDQVDSLEARGVEVGVVNSAVGAGEAEVALERAEDEDDTTKLLYVTPERFQNAEFMARAKGMDVSLLVVDEAHCISQWGHSFRPAYLGLGRVAQQLGRPALLALTATATPWVRKDIAERLGMRSPKVVVRGSDRPNLFLEVRRVEDEQHDRRELERLLTGEHGTLRYDEHPDAADGVDVADQLRDAMMGSGIVYCATTRAAQETAQWLQGWGITADYYHGQRKKADRERVQDQFMSGAVRVIAATNAFGLGVDKPDVRFVIHRDVPASVEEYYQEAGRAGRDGELARCTLIYRPGDLGRTAFLAGSGRLTREEVAAARPGLLKQRAGSQEKMEAASGLGRADFARLVEALKAAGLLRERRRRLELLVDDFDPKAVPLDAEERRQAYEASRVEMVRGYADVDACRRRYLLNYFGEDYEADACGRCDNDLRAVALAGDETEIPEKAACGGDALVAIGEQVEHTAFGPGTVQRVEEKAMTVLFENAGYKKLALGALHDPALMKKVA